MNENQASSTDQEYRTLDVNVAAFLVARGHPLKRLAGYRNERRVYCFATEAEAIAPNFSRDGKVVAQRFAAALHALRRIHRPLFPSNVSKVAA